MNSNELEHLVGGIVLCVGSAIAFGLVAAYLVWVIGGRK